MVDTGALYKCLNFENLILKYVFMPISLKISRFEIQYYFIFIIVF